MLQINEAFYHLQGKDRFVQKKHSHNEIEFIQVINGNGLVLKNDKTYILQNQHLYLIDARNTHIVNPQPEDCSNYIRNKIVIDADSFMNHFMSIGMGNILEKLFDAEPFSTAENPQIDRIFKMISELLSSKEQENIAFAHGYITELIHWLYINSQTKSQTENKDTFQKMLSVINEKDGVTSLVQISKALHLDKHYLCRLFKEKTGVKLSEYLADRVFKKTCNLLENTVHSIEEIAALCGFSSTSSLTRFFKAKSGVTPSKYRSDRKSILKLVFRD